MTRGRRGGGGQNKNSERESRDQGEGADLGDTSRLVSVRALRLSVLLSCCIHSDFRLYRLDLFCAQMSGGVFATDITPERFFSPLDVLTFFLRNAWCSYIPFWSLGVGADGSAGALVFRRPLVAGTYVSTSM